MTGAVALNLRPSYQTGEAASFISKCPLDCFPLGFCKYNLKGTNLKPTGLFEDVPASPA